MRQQSRVDLSEMAQRVMWERHLRPEFSPEALEQAAGLESPLEESSPLRDLRGLDWLSIDNETSQDIDQISVAEDLGNGRARVYVAIADVDAFVARDSPLDLHARYNTTSVYTVSQIFPMLPERLSHDLTSLREEQDRLAVVVSFVVNDTGLLEDAEIFQATARNKAKLTYGGVTAWLDGSVPMPEALNSIADLPGQLRLQDDVAQRLRARRQEHGALELDTVQPKAVLRNGQVVDLKDEPQNRAEELIEDLMIAVNGATAQFLEQQGFPTLRRVVHIPQRWDSIMRVAAEHGATLPNVPDSRALADFLRQQRQADPLRFPDLSLLVVKLMGPGEYALHLPGEPPAGHFGLAARDYAHSTAPNRRYPDLITQRILKAVLQGRPCPYSEAELAELAQHCTWKEDMADRVERQMQRTAAAVLLSRRVGEWFKAIVTSVTPKGVYARVLHPPVEGMIGSRKRKVEVGERISIRLAGVDVEKGYLDFVA